MNVVLNGVDLHAVFISKHVFCTLGQRGINILIDRHSLIASDVAIMKVVTKQYTIMIIVHENRGSMHLSCPMGIALLTIQLSLQIP